MIIFRYNNTDYIDVEKIIKVVHGEEELYLHLIGDIKLTIKGRDVDRLLYLLNQKES